MENHVENRIQEIAQAVQKAHAKDVKRLVTRALDEGIEPTRILDEGIMKGFEVIGEKFRKNEVFVPQMMLTARSINIGIKLLQPYMVRDVHDYIGTVVIGTVQGDLHNVGKNLVTLALKSEKFQVIDVGVDVAPELFMEKAEETQADIICMSALLTTTMEKMKDVVDILIENGVRDKYIVMVGGAPVNESFAKYIGADYYSQNAIQAAKVAKNALAARRKTGLPE